MPASFQAEAETGDHSPVVVFIMVWIFLGLFWGLGLGWLLWA